MVSSIKNSFYKEGILLSDLQLKAFDIFLSNLLDWNKNINLTALRKMEDIIDKLFIDSGVLIKLLSGNETIMDFGSGAGFPAIVLAILGYEVISLERNNKKLAFQNFIKAKLMPVLKLRLSFNDMKKVDVITLRGLKLTNNLVNDLKHCLKKEGRLFVMSTSCKFRAKEVKLRNNWEKSSVFIVNGRDLEREIE